MYNGRNGFTMIEVAIAILVAGILAALVSLGFDLVEDSRRRALIAEIVQYHQLVDRFQVQYNALPGDYANAFNVFGSSCAATAADCNGNGDGIIDWSITNTRVESLHAWQHLFLADMISKSYPGVATVNGQSDIGVNVPKSAWPNSGFELYVGATSPTGQTGNGLQIAGATPSSWLSAPIMDPQQAWSIDKKIDDGIGQKGKLLAFGVGTVGSCVGVDNINYNLGIKGRVCYIRYLFNPTYN